MPNNRYPRDEIVARAIARYFRDFGPYAMQPASDSFATYSRKAGKWRVTLQNVNGSLARYMASVDSAGRLRFQAVD